MSLNSFRELSVRDRVLVLIGVLLDGGDARLYLQNDSVNGKELDSAVNDLIGLEPDLRAPLVGTYLRAAVSELKSARSKSLR